MSVYGLPKPSILRPSNIRLKSCTYGNSKYFGTTTLQVAHYKTDRLKSFTYFTMEFKSEIILGHLARDRLSLTKVFCHNKAKKQV